LALIAPLIGVRTERGLVLWMRALLVELQDDAIGFGGSWKLSLFKATLLVRRALENPS